MQKSKWIIMLLLVIVLLFPNRLVFAQRVEESSEVQAYKIFDENGNLLFERDRVLVGDEYLTKDFKKYKVTFVNDFSRVGKAEFLRYIAKPDVSIDYTPKHINTEGASVGLYMTHNDESYVPTDGTESVYGAGGIHDVANSLKSAFENLGVTAYIDETLHIPHDTKAYSRSSSTVKKLINNHNPNALFDIHRDGSSRSSYVKSIGGVERCKVRIVVGKASSNFALAEQLAMYLLAVGEEVCDWLFLDIFYASGHYNQGMADKMLLFEMGSHLVEKELVLKSVAPLAQVVTTALFNTTVNEETGELTINGAVDDKNTLLNDALKSDGGGNVILSILLASLIAIGLYFIVKAIFKLNRKFK